MSSRSTQTTSGGIISTTIQHCPKAACETCPFGPTRINEAYVGLMGIFIPHCSGRIRDPDARKIADRATLSVTTQSCQPGVEAVFYSNGRNVYLNTTWYDPEYDATCNSPIFSLE